MFHKDTIDCEENADLIDDGCFNTYVTYAVRSVNDCYDTQDSCDGLLNLLKARIESYDECEEAKYG